MGSQYEGSTTTPARVLVTGATGTTGSLVVSELRRLGGTPVAASRHADPSDESAVHFDWDDQASFSPALDGADAVYLVPPRGSSNPAEVMVAFLRCAAQQGVRRAVLLGAASVGADDGGVGELYGRLSEFVPHSAVVRPSWFMQNFIGEHPQARSIRAQGVIRTATGNGAVPFIDARDIASVAATLLLADEPPQSEFVITGPRALTYDEVAAVITEVSGRPVHHERLTVEQMRDDVFGELPTEFAEMLAGMDAQIAEGRWQATTDQVERVTGRPPRSFEQFAQDNRASWT